MNVTCAGRKVNQEIIKIPPIGIANQLLQCVARHTATPKCSLIRINEETDRKQFYTVFLYRNNQVTSIDFFRIRTGIFHLEHLRHGRTENVSIKQTDLVAQLSQSHRQICGYGRFAYPSLTGRDTDYILYLRKQFAHFRTGCLLAFRCNSYLHIR